MRFKRLRVAALQRQCDLFQGQRELCCMQLVLEALQRQVEEFNSCGPQPLRDAMQLVTNAWCLMQSLLPMDDFTALIARWLSNRWQRAS